MGRHPEVQLSQLYHNSPPLSPPPLSHNHLSAGDTSPPHTPSAISVPLYSPPMSMMRPPPPSIPTNKGDVDLFGQRVPSVRKC